MTETLERICNILMKRGPISKEEYQEVPDLFRRMRTLLRIYYNAVMGDKKIADFKYCDAQNINDIGLRLHETGLFLQLSPARLRDLLDIAPDMERFLLDDPLDVGKYREQAARRDALFDSPDADLDIETREQILQEYDTSGSDQAGYQIMFFIADICVALATGPTRDRKDKVRAEKAMRRLVEWSTVKMYRDAFGDALTDAMTPIYRTNAYLVKFCQAGGIGALIGDWVESTFANTLCAQALEGLPNVAWNRQTPESLDVVTRELTAKIEREGDDITQTRIWANMMHQIYSRYGLKPFERVASKPSKHGVIFFYFIHRRASKRQQKLISVDDWAKLLEKYVNVPDATRRRHAWTIMTVPDRWESLDSSDYGCSFGSCPERAELLEIQQARVRGQRDAVAEDRLFGFGALSKACHRCKHVSYCGKECQAADWPNHRHTCKVEAAKNKTEEI
ncbi:hypothetical protein NEOLEDRAFT_1080591 [Neolentinus lepideus HHB14362 ss-1]|uniref:MYND-type domain-containing protein n=1 Tax=Neolentinus lepideus HHB14362 ss-1 TaxID=1314782 RepID=A0A165MGF4_9AGAM|nr:hypothetical protein NEOLEDRAFT_1080591 [Neolentinus lepideus HHB14362 ss-1]